MVNDPEGLRRAASRMYLAEFPEEIRVKTFVSRSPERLKEWVKGLRGPAVLKPLQPRGGAHVFFVDPREASTNLNQIITTVTKGGYAIAQQYQPEIEAGEKRLLLLGAEPVRVGKRVAIYRRHSLIGGADGAPHEATGNRARCGFGAAEARICDLLRPKLLADGLYFVGVDIVGDKVLELNVFTPGGIHSIRELYGVDVADVVIRDLERRVRRRAAYRTTFDPEAADTVYAPSALAGGLALPRTHPLADGAGAAKPRLPVLGPAPRSPEDLLRSSTFRSRKATRRDRPSPTGSPVRRKVRYWRSCRSPIRRRQACPGWCGSKSSTRRRPTPPCRRAPRACCAWTSRRSRRCRPGWSPS